MTGFCMNCNAELKWINATVYVQLLLRKALSLLRILINFYPVILIWNHLVLLVYEMSLFYMWCVARFGIICTIFLKNLKKHWWKTPMEECHFRCHIWCDTSHEHLSVLHNNADNNFLFLQFSTRPRSKKEVNISTIVF